MKIASQKEGWILQKFRDQEKVFVFLSNKDRKPLESSEQKRDVISLTSGMNDAFVYCVVGQRM